MDVKDYIVDYQDFPKPGVVFRDISPLLADPKAWSAVVDELAAAVWKSGATHILGLDARGFIVATAVAQRAKLPLIMARKPGKLPGQLYQDEYKLEYGSNTLAVQCDAIPADAHVAILDDVLATGGTICSAMRLVKKSVAKTCMVGFVMTLGGLDGIKAVSEESDRVQAETIYLHSVCYYE